MLVRRLVCLVALVAVTVGVLAAPAPAKILNGCAVLAQEELETIFEQPFAKGVVLQGDYCEFARDPANDIPDIRVRVLVLRYKDVAKAKREFERAVQTIDELTGGVSNVKGIGDEAFSANFIGTDLVTVREGRVVGRFTVDQPDSDNTFPDQVVAVAEAAAPRLENYSKAD